MLTWQKLVLYPAAIWAVIYLFICALIGFKVNTMADWVMIVTTLISLVGLYIASRAVNIKDIKKAIILGLVWVIVMVILDLILTAPFAYRYFDSWKTYVNYAIVFLMPIVISFTPTPKG
jgi:hypothetical protein